MSKRKITIPHDGIIWGLGGVRGPIETPHYRTEEEIAFIEHFGVTVEDCNDDGAGTQHQQHQQEPPQIATFSRQIEPEENVNNEAISTLSVDENDDEKKNGKKKKK